MGAVLQLVRSTRTCRGCGAQHVADAFPKKGARCYACLKLRHQRWAQTAEPAPTRVCTKCCVEKDVTQFGLAVRGGQRRLSRCKTCQHRADAARIAVERREYGRRPSSRGKPLTRRFNAIRSRARKEGIPFDLTIDDIFVPEFCPVLGIRLVWEEGNTRRLQDSGPSIDRLIPERGYVRGNIAVISGRANRIKNNGTAAEHERIAAWMRSLGAP